MKPRDIGFIIVAGLGLLAARELVTDTQRLLWVIAAMGGVQLAFALWFHREAGQRAERPGPAAAPKALVILPVKGAEPGLAENVRALLGQRYPGTLEFRFVVPDRRDPAFELLRPIIAETSRPAALLVSGREPQRASGKNLDLLHALEDVDGSVELLLFADGDIRTRPDWALSLAAALADPQVGCATSFMLYAPARPGFWALMRLFWMAGGMPAFTASPWPWGGSMAVRRSDFLAWKVGRSWARACNEEGPLRDAVRRAGKKVAFTPRAVSPGPGPCSGREFFSQFDRWFQLARHYHPLAWTVGGVGLAGKACIFLSGLWPTPRPEVLLALAAADSLYLFAVVLSLTLRFPSQLRGAFPRAALPPLASLCAPLLTAVYCGNFAHSVLARELTWGKTRYRIRGPEDVSALPSRRANTASSSSDNTASQ